jgi:hypothetical protein
MTEINHFKNFTFFSGDVTMTEQLRWISRMSKKWLKLIHLYSYRGYVYGARDPGVGYRQLSSIFIGDV